MLTIPNKKVKQGGPASADNQTIRTQMEKTDMRYEIRESRNKKIKMSLWLMAGYFV